MLLSDYNDIKESLEMILQDQVSPVQVGRIIGMLDDAVSNNMNLIDECLCLSCRWAAEFCQYWDDYCNKQEDREGECPCEWLRDNCSDYTEEIKK